MDEELSDMIFSGQNYRQFKYIQRKYNVSNKFLSYNMPNIRQFLLYGISLHAVLRKYAIRKPNNRVIIQYFRLRRLLFEPKNTKMIKRRKRNVKQWSRRMVNYFKSIGRTFEYEETERYNVMPEPSNLGAEEVSKQLKEQLQLLKSGKRSISLIDDKHKDTKSAVLLNEISQIASTTNITLPIVRNCTQAPPSSTQIIIQNIPADSQNKETIQLQTIEDIGTSSAKEADIADAQINRNGKIPRPKSANNAANSETFVDMLMNKFRVKSFANVANFNRRNSNDTNELLVDKVEEKPHADTSENSCEEFLGFDESDHQPGMLLTPLVPGGFKSNTANAAFESETLNEYLRQNNILLSNEVPLNECNKDKEKQKISLEGLVTPDSVPPHMDMPAVPESLQKLRTVAERKQYLQRFSKNHKLVIINNEANIYRELQRKIRKQKVKAATMLMLQAPTTNMPFTRAGWKAASYIATEYNKYYYQTIEIDGEVIKLAGVLGNNEVREKPKYCSKVPTNAEVNHCSAICLDKKIWRELKIIKTQNKKAKLNKFPLPAVFRPCPLSQKAFQKPLDDDTAALLLAGGSMAVVSMPTIQMDVYPEYGKPLNEIAKRYLQYILPHHDITREWAEFSVSTLQEPKTMREAEQAAAKVVAGRRTSFTFAIPYLHDRSQLLVRRVVDRSEKLDKSFEMAQQCDTDAGLCNLSFRTNVDKSDAVLTDCADMVTEMINTVAISCSENSFIKEDPHGFDFNKNPEENNMKMDPNIKLEPLDAKRSDSKCGTLTVPKKQHRLRLELRRLNATIIDAAAKSEFDEKSCMKEECQLGCICESIAGEMPMREHCGKADCVISCTCKSAIQARITRLETDGRGISNEDAFLLRRKATARLARMEKEFTSTVVLTENETLLINESQRDKKRRCTKAPKRYEDFTDNEDEFLRNSPKKPASCPAVKGTMMAIETSDSSSHSASPQIMELREPCTVLDTDFEKLKHCTVALRRLPDVSNVVTFCMTHQLYKCFCGGVAIEGKPVMIDKEEVNSTISNSNINNLDILSKAHYSFDKVENPIAKQRLSQIKSYKAVTATKEIKTIKHLTPKDFKIASEEVNDTIRSQTMKTVTVKDKSDVNRTIEAKPIIRTTYHDIINEYMKPNSGQCRRTIKIPRKSYMHGNRKRAAQILQKMAVEETQETREILVLRIQGAVRFYRSELEKERRLLMEKRNMVNGPVIEVRDDDEDDDVTHELENNSKKNVLKRAHEEVSKNTKEPNREIVHPVPIKMKKIEKPAQSQRSLLLKNQFKNNKPPPVEAKASEPSTTTNKNSEPSPVIQIPKIAACYSLSPTMNSAIPASTMTLIPPSTINNPNTADVINAESAELNANDNCNVPEQHFKEFYNDVVKNMNTLVSKKMQDIDMALQRESKLIPAPNEEILCIIKWTNFLAAYESGFVYIWEVNMRNYNFLAATITNMMPIVCGAIGVVNILGLKLENLPLLARMLLEHTHTEATSRLAVVMQGRNHYWLIKGFLRHMAGNACTKPTPSSHPLLTKKINVLCSLLVKQRIKEHQRKTAENGQTTNDTQTTAVVSSVKTPPPPTVPIQTTMPPLKIIETRQQTTAPSTANTAITNSISPAVVATTPVIMPLLAKLALPTTTQQRIIKPQPEIEHPLEFSVNEDIVIKSNIEFRKVTESDVNVLQLPEQHIEDHRWLVLDLHNDFSHIFVPAFKDMISLDRVQNVMQVSREKNKVVKLQFFQDAPYDAFVTPTSLRKIYFGPLKLTMPPPVLVLLQSVDGNMMLREVYQRDHHINVNLQARTTAFWVLLIKKQVHFEVENDSIDCDVKQSKLPNEPFLSIPITTIQANTLETNDSDEDDCVIIDDTKLLTNQDKTQISNNTQRGQGQRINFTIQAASNKKIKITTINSLESTVNEQKPKMSTTSADCAILPDLWQRSLMQFSKSSTSATASSEVGFVPLIANMPANSIITNPTIPPTKAAFILSSNAQKFPLLSAINNVNDNVETTSTYITPQVKLTQTPTLTPFVVAPPIENLPQGQDYNRFETTNKHPTAVDEEFVFKKIKLSNTMITNVNEGKIATVSISPKPTNYMSPATTAVSTTPTATVASGTTTPRVQVAKKRTSGGSIKSMNSKNKTQNKQDTLKNNANEASIGANGKTTSKSIYKISEKNKIVPAPSSSLTTITNGKNTKSIKTMAAMPPGNSTTTNANAPPHLLKTKAAHSANNNISNLSKVPIKFVKTQNTTTPVHILPKKDNKMQSTETHASKQQKIQNAIAASTSKNNDSMKIQFGYMYALDLPKFAVKSMNNQYIMNVPGDGVIRLRGMDGVNRFLNEHLKGNANYKSKIPAKWQFIPYKRTINEKNEHTSSSSSSQKPASDNKTSKINNFNLQNSNTIWNEKHKNLTLINETKLKSSSLLATSSSSLAKQVNNNDNDNTFQTDTILIED